jgi:hypothetical protein
MTNRNYHNAPKLFAAMVFVSVLFCNNAFAQFTLKATIDTSNYTIGDYIKLKLAATYDSSYTIQFPVLPETIQLDSLHSIEVIATDFSDSTINGKIIKHNAVYTLMAFDSGSYSFQPLTVLFFDKKENLVDSLQSNTITFFVATIEVDTAQGIKPIKDPLDLPFTIAEIKDQLIYGTLVLLLIILAIYLYLRYRKKPKPIVEAAPEIKRPSHEIALEKLEDLKQQKLWQQGEVKAYHSALSEIIREYLENRFDIVALEATTDEIVEKMRIFAVAKEQKMALQELLELADLVKFAKVKPLPDEHERSYKIAFEFIMATKYEEHKQ